MHIRITTLYGRTAEMSLADACTPTTAHEGGAVERATQQAELNARVIGQILAYLVDKGRLPLNDAQKMIEDYDEWEVVK